MQHPTRVQHSERHREGHDFSRADKTQENVALQRLRFALSGD